MIEHRLQQICGGILKIIVPTHSSRRFLNCKTDLVVLKLRCWNDGRVAIASKWYQIVLTGYLGGMYFPQLFCILETFFLFLQMMLSTLNFANYIQNMNTNQAKQSVKENTFTEYCKRVPFISRASSRVINIFTSSHHACGITMETLIKLPSNKHGRQWTYPLSKIDHRSR